MKKMELIYDNDGTVLYDRVYDIGKGYEDREGKSPYDRFFQVNKDNAYLLQLIMVRPTAAQVFLTLVQFMNEYNKICISYEDIARLINLKDAKNIYKHLKFLKEANYIFKAEKNTYIINPKIVCRTSLKKLLSSGIDFYTKPKELVKLENFEKVYRKTSKTCVKKT